MIFMRLSPQVRASIPEELCWGVSFLSWVTLKMPQEFLTFQLKAPVGMGQ